MQNMPNSFIPKTIVSETFALSTQTDKDNDQSDIQKVIVPDDEKGFGLDTETDQDNEDGE